MLQFWDWLGELKWNVGASQWPQWPEDDIVITVLVVGKKSLENYQKMVLKWINLCCLAKNGIVMNEFVLFSQKLVL